MPVYRSIFDIIGPVMIGPSSSHTAGCARIGRAARNLFGRSPSWANVLLYGSLAQTYRGHASDVAIIGGILGFDTYDPRIPSALDIAARSGLAVSIQPNDSDVSHPNTARVQLGDSVGSLDLVGVSTGGGNIQVVEVDGFSIRLSGEHAALLVFHSDRPGAIATVGSVLAEHGVNIAGMEVSRRGPGGDALMVIEVDDEVDEPCLRAVRELAPVAKLAKFDVRSRISSRLRRSSVPAQSIGRSVAELVSAARTAQTPISEIVLQAEAELTGRTQEDILGELALSLEVMDQSVLRGLTEDTQSVSGLSGGDALRLSRYLDAGRTLAGSATLRAVSRALATNEVNAAMGVICASPTAGSAGVIAGTLSALSERLGLDAPARLRYLLCAAGFGLVIANNAYVAGSAGGCQAEIGSATAMAAAAAVEVAGGAAEQSAHAAALALKSLLGLVCDPVAGLVEIPCIKRNGFGAATALVAADMALAGIGSRIPCDEVIEAMRRVGDLLPVSLKETAQGGLAATRTGQTLQLKIFGDARGSQGLGPL